MVQKFTISHVSLIMIILFQGWELVNNAARLSLLSCAARTVAFDVIRLS